MIDVFSTMPVIRTCTVTTEQPIWPYSDLIFWKTVGADMLGGPPVVRRLDPPAIKETIPP